MAGGVLYSSNAVGLVEAMDPAAGPDGYGVQEAAAGPMESSTVEEPARSGFGAPVMTGEWLRSRGPYLMALNAAKTGKGCQDVRR